MKVYKKVLQDILDKRADKTTSLEHAIHILFLNEQTIGKPETIGAAEEFARLKRIESAAKAVVRRRDVGPLLEHIDKLSKELKSK